MCQVMPRDPMRQSADGLQGEVQVERRELRDNLLQDDDGHDQPDHAQRAAHVAPAFPPQPSPDAHHCFIPFNPAASGTYVTPMTHAPVVGGVRAYLIHRTAAT